MERQISLDQMKRIRKGQFERLESLKPAAGTLEETLQRESMGVMQRDLNDQAQGTTIGTEAHKLEGLVLKDALILKECLKVLRTEDETTQGEAIHDIEDEAKRYYDILRNSGYEYLGLGLIFGPLVNCDLEHVKQNKGKVLLEDKAEYFSEILKTSASFRRQTPNYSGFLDYVGFLLWGDLKAAKQDNLIAEMQKRGLLPPQKITIEAYFRQSRPK